MFSWGVVVDVGWVGVDIEYVWVWVCDVDCVDWVVEEVVGDVVLVVIGIVCFLDVVVGGVYLVCVGKVGVVGDGCWVVIVLGVDVVLVECLE